MDDPITYWAVYCGSSSGIDPDFILEAHYTGRLLARLNYGVIYGGGETGLMGAVAAGVLSEDGHIIGIITDLLTGREGIHPGLSTLHVVPTMHARKMMMFEKSDGFIILPGGAGTLDEFFEILVWLQLEIHRHPIIIINFKNYWAPLLVLLDHMIQKQFFPKSIKDSLHIVETHVDLPTVFCKIKHSIF